MSGGLHTEAAMNSRLAFSENRYYKPCVNDSLSTKHLLCRPPVLNFVENVDTLSTAAHPEHACLSVAGDPLESTKVGCTQRDASF